MIQPIYKVIGEEFESFVEGNKGILIQMEYNHVINLKEVSNLVRIGLLDPPISVMFLAKIDGGEGPVYIFMDNGFNRLYSYYDVI